MPALPILLGVAVALLASYRVVRPARPGDRLIYGLVAVASAASAGLILAAGA